MADGPRPLASILGEPYAGGLTLAGGLDDGSIVSDLDLEDCTIIGGSMERSTWRRCTLERVRLIAVNLSRSTFTDTRLTECAMTESKAQAVNWTGLRSGLGGASISFEHCRLDYGSFQGMDIRGMRFTDGSLVDADFAGADCREVEFVDCDLSGAHFAGADLRGTLFADVRGLALDLRETRTRGMRVDASAALDLVTALGIEIVESRSRVTP